MDARSPGGHPNRAPEGKCHRGYEVVQPRGASCKQFAASPHFDRFPTPPNASREYSSFECHDPVTGRTARSEAKYGLRGHRLGEASNPGPRSFLRRPGPFARNVVPRLGVEPVVDCDEEPLLPGCAHSFEESTVGPTQLESATNCPDSLGSLVSGGSGVVAGGNVHEQEANGDGNAEPTVPTISFRDVDSDATGADDMPDQEVVHVARRRLVLLGLDDQVRGS